MNTDSEPQKGTKNFLVAAKKREDGSTINQTSLHTDAIEIRPAIRCGAVRVTRRTGLSDDVALDVPSATSMRSPFVAALMAIWILFAAVLQFV